jgi:hypothetical protein
VRRTRGFRVFSLFLAEQASVEEELAAMVNVGSLLRFKGLIFDDSGTMRMDASEIYDGVTE